MCNYENSEVREVMGLGTEYWEKLILMAKVAGMYVHPAISDSNQQTKAYLYSKMVATKIV